MAAHRIVPTEPDLAQFVDEVLTVLPWLVLFTVALIAAVTT